MPQIKSFSCFTLRHTCLQFVAEQIKLLQHHAKELPETVIRDLYKECCDNISMDRYFSSPICRLPSEVFITASTLRINGFLGFDLPRRKIVNKVCNECKNLRELSFGRDWTPLKLTSAKFSKLLISFPKIEHLDLENVSDVTDHHLFLIAQHCPLLRYLSLDKCGNITDEGIKFLSQNTEIHHLDLCKTNITPEGCVIALKNLKKLINLTQDHWGETIELLQAELYTGGKPVTYSIDSLIVGDIKRAREYNVGETIAMLFPKLKRYSLNNPKTLHSSFIFLTPNLGKNLTIVETKNVPFDMIRLIGHFCPMLETLELTIIKHLVKSYDEYLETPHDHVPYQRLHALSLAVNDGYLPRKWLRMLFENCHLLDFLILNGCHRVSDDFSYVMQLGNQFRHLNHISFLGCKELSLSSVQMLLEFFPAVRYVEIDDNCLDASDLYVLEDYIENMNWDVTLYNMFSVIGDIS